MTKNSVCNEGGIYRLFLPLFSGKNALLTGLCLPKITTEFPTYDLGSVENEIRKNCKQQNQNLVHRLPNRYFPKPIFKLETGLEIFVSVFVSPCGSHGVVSGPHKDFSETEKDFKGTHVEKAAFTGGIFEHATEKIRNFSNLSCHVTLFGIKSIPNIHDLDEPLCCNASSVSDHSCCSLSESENVYIGKTRKPRAPKCVRQFDDVEKAGTEVSFRCVDCRGCMKSKRGERIEAISIQEEVEQDLIEWNVFVDPDKCVTSCKLPFLVDPESRLVPNDNGALQVFRQQVRKLNANPEDKAAVIKSQQKLQDLGFVDFVSNLKSLLNR